MEEAEIETEGVQAATPTGTETPSTPGPVQGSSLEWLPGPLLHELYIGLDDVPSQRAMLQTCRAWRHALTALMNPTTATGLLTNPQLPPLPVW